MRFLNLQFTAALLASFLPYTAHAYTIPASPQATFNPIYVPNAQFQVVATPPLEPTQIVVPSATFAPTHYPVLDPTTAYVPNASFNPTYRPPTPVVTPFPGLCDVFPRLCRTPAAVYTILGDSIGLGLYGAPGYADIVEDHWEDINSIEIDSRNLSRAGWHSSHLAAALQSNNFFQNTIAESDVVTWNIGGNDLRVARELFYEHRCGGEDNQECLRHAVTSFRSNWNVIVTELTAARSKHGVHLQSMDLYNPYVKEDMAQGTYAILAPYFAQVNSHITSSLRANHIPYAKVSNAFNGPDGLADPADKGLIAFDGYHPNSAGHDVIATLITNFGNPVTVADKTPYASPSTLPTIE